MITEEQPTDTETTEVNSVTELEQPVETKPGKTKPVAKTPDEDPEPQSKGPVLS